MHLPHPPPIRLRHRDFKILNPHPLALLGQMPEQMRHITADRAHIGIFQIEPGEVV
jgi:hypothetical protein